MHFSKKMSQANKQHRGHIMKFANLCFTLADIERARPSSDSPLLMGGHQDEIDVGHNEGQDAGMATSSIPPSSPAPEATPQPHPSGKKRKRSATSLPKSKSKSKTGRGRRAADDDDETDSDSGESGSEAEESAGSDAGQEGDESGDEASPPPAKRVHVSQYERNREEQIKKNKALFVELGLDKPAFSDPPPKKRQRSTVSNPPAPNHRTLRSQKEQPPVASGDTPPTPTHESPLPASVSVAPAASTTPAVPTPAATPSVPTPAAAATQDVDATLDAIAEASRLAVTAPTWFSYPHEVLRDKDAVLGADWKILVAEWTLLDKVSHESCPLKYLT
ncbi:hypothetical protein CYLTODRAFT_460646 [Cylindrobasidium torrendii FP15055 ss-10]|uniref:Uncharacterized protein n=1 Tax=Cylindrobasidium torrendii FP15055 ss-10 TaxID=1314674 RepID=A0A0D7AQT5_9AGAR|nr:hypothetical protein CYLTODRAFT_460646 [Cylindrobasidium torrendii FP15055 ss-10]